MDKEFSKADRKQRLRKYLQFRRPQLQSTGSRKITSRHAPLRASHILGKSTRVCLSCRTLLESEGTGLEGLWIIFTRVIHM